MAVLPDPNSAEQRGLREGLRIHRCIAPSSWRTEIDAIEDVAERAVAERYLRDIAERHRAAAAARRHAEPA